MDHTAEQFHFRQGDKLVSADGEALGEVQRVGPNFVEIKKGFLFPTEYFVPFSVVEGYDAERGEVRLRVGKNEASSSGWDAEPAPENQQFTSATLQEFGHAVSTEGTDAQSTPTAEGRDGAAESRDRVAQPHDQAPLTAGGAMGGMAPGSSISTNAPATGAPIADEAQQIAADYPTDDPATRKAALYDDATAVIDQGGHRGDPPEDALRFEDDGFTRPAEEDTDGKR